MRLWNWQESGVAALDRLDIPTDRPTVIICGGSFNVDDPSEPLRGETPQLKAFFDFVAQYLTAPRQVFKELVCGPLEGKLKQNYFMLRKLLGMVSAVPSDPCYPASLTSGFSNEARITEISYSSASGCFENIARIHARIDYCSDDARAFARMVFGPLLSLYRRNMEELCAHLGHITFFGISYGSHFIIEVENAFNALLEKEGYDIPQRTRILKSLCSIVVSSTANVKEAEGARFTSVYFEGTNDKMARWINPYKTPLPMGMDSGLVFLAPHRLLVLLPVTVTAERWLEIIPDTDYLWLDNDKGAHYTPFYTMRCLPRNLQPELLERALRNAVRRTRNPIRRIMDIFKPSASLNAYIQPFYDDSALVEALLSSARQLAATAPGIAQLGSEEIL